MLGVFKLIFFCCCCFFSCVWLNANTRPIVTLIHEEPETQILNYAQSIEDETQIKEIVDKIVQLRQCMVSQGCFFPRLTCFLEYCRVQAYAQGVEIDDAIFDRLWQEFAYHEQRQGLPCETIKHKHHHGHKHHPKKEKEVRVSGRMAVGFLKFVGGSLLCLIPVPVVQSAGVSLAVIGVNDMLNASRDEAALKEAEERIESNRRMDAALEK